MSSDRFLTPEEMYRRRRVRKNVGYISLGILSVAIILALQILLYKM